MLKLNTYNIKNIPLRDYFKRDSLVVFHHIHKTAGTSLETLLSKWFILKRDFNLYKAAPISNLRNCHCKSGHYGYHNVHLRQLYPNLLDNSHVKVFSIVREPLQRAISHYHHWKKSEFHGFENLLLEDYLMGKADEEYIQEIADNWMARMFDVDEYNYQNILDKYFFIGIFEDLQNTCNTLADKLNKPQYLLPEKRKGQYKKIDISQNTVEVFKKRNELDYKIYQYALARLERDNH